ncbi:putative transporter small subunit [Saccharomonospora piscinae]|nr:putative transporter small subunit [Saccharomonospora piscinae]
METLIVTAYILVWPLLTAVVLAVLTRGVIRDYGKAKEGGTTVV